MLFRGFSGAHDRFMMDGRIAAESADAYMPMFEALSWAVALDKRLATEFATGSLDRDWSWRERFQGGEVVAAFRFARNRAHHDWGCAPVDCRCSSANAASVWLLRVALAPVSAPGRHSQGEEEYAVLLTDEPRAARPACIASMFFMICCSTSAISSAGLSTSVFKED